MERSHNDPHHLKLLFVIVDKHEGKKVLATLDDLGVRYLLACHGHGTAKSEILKYLGLGETEKDVIIGVGAAAQISTVIQRLDRELHFDHPGHGIAFTIPVNGVSSKAGLEYIMGTEEVRNHE